MSDYPAATGKVIFTAPAVTEVKKMPLFHTPAQYQCWEELHQLGGERGTRTLLSAYKEYRRHKGMRWVACTWFIVAVAEHREVVIVLRAKAKGIDTDSANSSLGTPCAGQSISTWVHQK